MSQHSAISSQHSGETEHLHPQDCPHEPSFWAKLFHSAGYTFSHALRRYASAILKTLVETLREIFDENAYARFLAEHGMISGKEAYAEYLRESNLTRERRPRCC